MRPVIYVLLALLSLAPAALGARFAGVVTAVSDGDTITVKLDNGTTEKVRLIGVDAPESAQAPHAPAATAYLARLVLNQRVSLETDVQSRDRYGRLLAYVHSSAGFVNLKLIQQGHAVILTIPPNVAHQASFLTAQRQARDAGLGVWDPRAPLAVSPADWRAGKRPPARARPAAAPAARPPSRAPSGRYDPRGPDRDCGDFTTHAEAQAFFEAAGPGDPHRLDGNRDGRACESLP